MFKHYKELSDVVSLLAYCPADKSYLLTKETSGEYWLPSYKSEKNCWKITASKINFELFGAESTCPCIPMRVYKIWLPMHPLASVYHAVFKVSLKHEVKKKTKLKGHKNRAQWLSAAEVERQRAHSNFKSPEVLAFTQMAMGEMPYDSDCWSGDSGLLIEICEENMILATEAAAAGGAAVVLASPNYQLLQAANYNKDDQVRLYREFLLMVYPALYMSMNIFTQFMIELGWQRTQCFSLFRAADINGRGGLSFLELMLWTAALEPATQHSGIPAEIRCRYIFRYFDTNRDLKLEYEEFKELVGATRSARQLPTDGLSVARDADNCLRQLGLLPNTQLPLNEFLRGVGELRLRGTSSLLRAPRSISGYLVDLEERDKDMRRPSVTKSHQVTSPGAPAGMLALESSSVPGSLRRSMARADYSMAVFTVRLRRANQSELLELRNFEEDAVSPSTTKVVPLLGVAPSLEVLGPSSCPVEAMAAVHYFATAVEKLPAKKTSNTMIPSTKPKWTWSCPAEEQNMGAMLLRLAEAVRPICASESRLMRLNAPVYAIGDLHGNLKALLSMETALWPSGPALAPATILFLGDYVDRGPHGTELMAYLLAAKLQRPRGIALIRGNHETRDIQKMFTFHVECITKYGDQEGTKIWNAINQVFDALPLAAVVDDKVFCCHGGIPPPWVCPLITAIDKVPVPLSRPAEQSTIAWELLWNDPVKPNKMTATLALELTANEGFAANAKRGTGHVFDQTALDRFLLANQLSHVVRAHEMQQFGFSCQLRGRLVSVFSSSHYCGGTNDSGIALLQGGKLRLIQVIADF